MVDISKNNPRLLGIEIGGTKLQVGLGHGDGRLIALERCRAEPSRGAAGILEKIQGATDHLLEKCGVSPKDLDVVGIGFGGPVDSDRGVVVLSNQITGWDGYPLVEWTRQNLGVDRVVLRNDAAAAALGEARYGAGVGFNPVLYLTIGSGIGGGLIVDGRIYRGSGRGSIEVGHLIVQGFGGSKGDETVASRRTLENIASGWSIAREGQRLVTEIRGGIKLDSASPLTRLCGGETSKITSEMVAQAAIEGDPGAKQILSNARIALGQALAHAITLLSPRRIILGGGVSRIGEENWFEPIREEIDRRVFSPFRGTYDLVPAALGEEVVVHGALALALDAFRRNQAT